MLWGTGRRAFLRSVYLCSLLLIDKWIQTRHVFSHLLNLDSASSDKKSAAHGDAAPKYTSYQEVQKHNMLRSCWVILEGQVYDDTSVLKWHPAGLTVILKNLGS
ncbi:hypothetical protein BKA93DRAFT_744774 [Sparassis latifolia]